MEKIMNIDATTAFTFLFGIFSLVMFWFGKKSMNQGVNKSNKKCYIVLGITFILFIAVTVFNLLIPIFYLQLAFIFFAMILVS